MDEEIKQIEELLTDDSFLNYCNGDEKEKLRWEKRMQENSELKKRVYQATKLVELVKAELTDTAVEAEIFSKNFQQHIAIKNTRIENKAIVVQMPFKTRRRTSTAAAAVLLLLGTVSYFLFINKVPQKIAKTEQQPKRLINDVAPGGNRAVLTLADGSSIILDSAKNGALAQQGNVKVTKLNNGQLAYNTYNGQSSEVLYNTVSTPKGGQYKITLSDGTGVWLNAASSIRYPAAFAGKERKVEITGEAYFEVAKNAGLPFKVAAKGMEVEVLGTHFNVNSYDDEPTVRTTLLEGAVKIKKNAVAALMKPGQQVQLSTAGELMVIENADVEEALAWKNGLFQFNNTSLNEILRQLVRWYDVEVKFEGKLPSQRFGGEISRNNNLSEVLQILNFSRIKFAVEGKTIIVKS